MVVVKSGRKKKLVVAVVPEDGGGKRRIRSLAVPPSILFSAVRLLRKLVNKLIKKKKIL